MGEAKRRTERKAATSEDPGRDEIVLVGVIESLRVGRDRNTDEVVAGAALISTAADEAYIVMVEADEPRRALLALYVGAAARFIGRLSPAPNFPKFKGVIVPSAITPVERDEIVVVATVELVKRAWSVGGGIAVALAHIITKDEDRFTVSSRGGEPTNALLSLNPDDVVRFTGRFSPPLEELPNIELSRVALIERGGRVEPWRDEWFFVSTDRLSPDFRRRVAGLKLPKGVCTACDGSIETADQIALIMLRGCKAGMVCADCGALPRDELIEKLSVFEGTESGPARFVHGGLDGSQERQEAPCMSTRGSSGRRHQKSAPL